MLYFLIHNPGLVGLMKGCSTNQAPKRATSKASQSKIGVCHTGECGALALNGPASISCRLVSSWFASCRHQRLRCMLHCRQQST